MSIIDELYNKRKVLTESILWGFPWNKKKIDDIDKTLEVIRQFMLTMCRLGFHEDYPYKNAIETENLIKKLRQKP